MTPDQKLLYPRKTPWVLALIFSMLSVGILVLGYVYYKNHVSLFLRDKEGELKTIADMKVNQIMEWRLERMHDAKLVFEDPIFASHVQDWFDGKGEADLRELILLRLAGLKQDFYEALVLVDPQGVSRLSVPELPPELSELAKTICLEALATGEIVFTDFYLIAKTNKTYLSLAIPLHFSKQGKRITVGALLYQIDPNHFLYPILRSWPTPSKSAELVMIRKASQENKIVFLNELRFWEGAPLTLRRSLTEAQLPSVMAALGKEGIVRGIDYRGVPVLAANRTIPDSPWFLTAKVDMDELQGPLRKWFAIISFLGFTLVALAGLAIAFVWRHGDAQFYKRQYALESERRALAQRCEYLTKSANDIILIMDQDWKIIEANDRALAAYGLERDELYSRRIWDLFADTRWYITMDTMVEVEGREGLRFEAVNRRQDGTTFPVEISSSLMEIEGNRFHLYIVRDVTERKQRETALQESEQQLRFLSSRLLTSEENERRRISKELHDELGQALMVLRFQVNALKSKLPKNRKTLIESCDSMLGYLDEIIENVRRLSRALSPLALKEFGLAAAIKKLFSEFEAYYDIKWDAGQLEGIADFLPLLLQINIYRVLQEVLTNIAKHGEADKIIFEVEKQDHQAIFNIEDNGKGFDPREVMNRDIRDRGSGLGTMRERVQMMGGSLTIASQPGSGTKLVFNIPFDKRSEGSATV